MNSNKELIEYLINNNLIRSKKVIEAFENVDRIRFIPDEFKEQAYIDNPLPIGEGQTISAPHMVAMMTENLDVNQGDKVLEVGTGSGYQAAILSRLVGENGKIITTEINPKLAVFASNNLDGLKNVTVVEWDGSKGYKKESPYDRIIVTAAAPEIPKPLIDQLKNDGKIAIPVGEKFQQTFKVIKKKNKEIISEDICECIFVPLTGKYGFSD